MSLINKMLQDLDARGTGHGDAAQPHIKAVAQVERGVPLRVVVGTLVGVLALGVAGAAGWRYLRKAPVAAQPVTVVMAPAHPAAVAIASPPLAALDSAPAAAAVSAAAAPATMSAAAPAAAMTAASPATTVTAGPAAAAASASSRAVAAIATAPSATQAIPAAVPGAVAAPSAAAALAAAHADALAGTQADAPVANRAKMTRKEKRLEKAMRAAEKQEQARARKTADARAAKAGHAPDVRARHETEMPLAAIAKGKHGAVIEGREETSGQRAEGAYRRALANLQEGRVTEAMAALRQALQVDAHHDAARQTLVGLLIEHGQPEEAMHQLQLGLTLDPRQPALAMLLARLQIERGGSGVETLMRTLPYAAGNGEYHAFLAGALQRQQRHREAAEQYQAALRGGVQNGVWWMGLGISLQAEKRDAEAVAAFQKAKASGTLSPELLAFVERKLRALR